ncbi:TPR-like protein [Sistotremastrum niveocremeum HHB9708]|uniref:TPR-like protein n=1 Tax=Sistotremastrum niveocremeum HHB9708 TaxID=1314777 RepID=A0A164VJ09_9AGAM|nr:TPR-like protein [Sistotremastrum niveocremeum HHB9708]
MGRQHPKTKTGRSVPQNKAAATKTASTSKPAPSIPALLTKVQELLTQCNYELALKFLQRILSQSPRNVEALGYLGIVQIETGELESAKQTFLSLLPPNEDIPNPPPASAHLYLAQLQDEDPRMALTHYQAALDILAAKLKASQESGASDNSEDDETKLTAIRAIVSMVEIWMTDLCFEPEAEAQCDSLLQTALSIDPTNSEALMSLSSVRMSQSRPDEARELAERAWEGWKDIKPEDPKQPSPSVLLSLTRLFLELALYPPALAVIQSILAVDDQEVEAWYLEGWCFVLMSEQVKETSQKIDDLSAEELAQDARDCLEMCKMLHENQDHPDDALLEHTKELISNLEAAGVHPSPIHEEEEGGAEDEVWEDLDEDEDGDVDMS